MADRIHRDTLVLINLYARDAEERGQQLVVHTWNMRVVMLFVYAVTGGVRKQQVDAPAARGRRRCARHQAAGYSPTRHIDSYPRRVHSPVRSAAARVRDVERHSCRYTRQRAAGDSEPHCGGHQREHPAALLEATGGAHQVATRGRPVRGRRRSTPLRTPTNMCRTIRYRSRSRVPLH